VASLLPRRTQYCGAEVTSIYAQSASEAWATGWQGCQDTGGRAVLLHYARGGWHRVAGLGAVDPTDILPDGHGAVWIRISPDPQQKGSAQVLRYAGGTLRRVSVAVLRSLDPYDTAVLRKDGTVFAVGVHDLGRGGRPGWVLRYRP
jgi:hypothetical protein